MWQWIMFLNVGSIFSIYAYAFVVNFLESTLLLLVATIPSIVFPVSWWKEKFVPKGATLAIVIMISAQVHIHLYRTPDVQNKLLSGQLTWWIVTFLVAFFLSWMAGRFSLMDKTLVEIAERLGLFLYFYLPLTVISFIVILARIFL